MTSPKLLSEDDIERLIPAFYDRIRNDIVLGPIFNNAISDWPEHLDTLQSFWSSIILGTGRYKGQPMIKHLPHHQNMTLANFERWLSLWYQTTSDLLLPNQAAILQRKANRIAESLRLGIEFYQERSSQS
jgi:hemoglobin